MATVRGDVRLNDFMTRTLQSITRAVNMTVSEMDRMQRKVGGNVSTSGLNKIREEVAKVDIEIEKAVEEQERLNKKVQETSKGYGAMGNVIKTALGTIGVQKLVGLSDRTVQTRARLKLMTGGTDEEVKGLEDKIFASAQRSRADYLNTSDLVSKLGMRARKTFGNPDELIRFSETLNKMYTIAGASQQEIASSSLQLTQALGSGVLRGEEFNAVYEAAPNIMEAVAEYMGQPIEKIRELASEGKITADVVKNAMLSVADEVDKDFNNTTMTWGQIWTMGVNKVIRASQPLLKVISVLAQNWSVLRPIVLAIAAAIGAYTTVLLVHNAQQAISNGLKTMAAISAVAHGTATAAEAAATTGMTTAQVAFNAALYACPLTWILVIIIAIVGIIYAVIAGINKAKGTTISATGVIAGVLMTAVAFINNLFVGLLEIVLGIVNYCINPYIEFANFLGNVFNNPVSSIIYLFQGLADNILGVLEKIASAMDFIFGSNMAETVGQWRAGLKNMADEVVKEYAPNENYQDIMGNLDLSAEGLGFKRMAYGDAYNKGYAWGQGAEDKISNLFNGSNTLGDIGSVGNVENVSGEVDVASEDLKLLRELAEQQYIQNYISNDPVVYVTTGDVHENADIDYLIKGVAYKIKEEIDTSMEGVPV